MSTTHFINRVKEQAWLGEKYQQALTEGQLLILYGKRRVGKTELIKHFSQDKSCLYFVADKGTAQDQLKTLSQIVAQYFNEPYLNTFESWRTLFEYLGRKLKERVEPLIIVFDEFPYLVESDEAMSSYFLVGWDEYLKDTPVVMILMGSSIAMMYKHTLAYNAPLYGRRTGQWLLEPFSYQETRLFYPSAPFNNTFPLYAITGGIPAYARVFDGEKSLEENIRQYILPEGSFLSVEPELLLSEEFTDPRSFLSILKAIGLGRTRFTEIVSATGLPSTAMSGFLQTLMTLRLIKKEVPVTEPIPEKSKKGSYSLADGFLRFYFSFIYPNSSLIKGGGVDTLFAQHSQTLTNLVAKSYEETTLEFITQAYVDGALPHFEKMGRWWEKDVEIDVVGLNEHNDSILFVETKWNDKPIGLDVLRNLQGKTHAVQWGSDKRKEYFALVAKGGFTEELKVQAQRENVVLIQETYVVVTE